MKIKTKVLQEYMQSKEMTVTDLAREMAVDVVEIEKLLNGQAVSEEIARSFIFYFGANAALLFIDWEAMNKENPFQNGEV